MSKSRKLTVESKITNNSAAENVKYLQDPSSSNDRTVGCSTTIKASSKRAAKHMQSTHSDGSLIKSSQHIGFKQKLVNKVKSWNNREGKVRRIRKENKETPDLVADFQGLTLSPEASEDNLFKSDWLRARDSLENLLNPRSEKSEIVNSKSTHFPSIEKPILNESPCSESQIGSSKAMNSVSRVLAWDPWDKLGRKSKKENKRRKREKSPTDNCIVPSSKDHTSGDELRNGETSNNQAAEAATAHQEGDEYLQTTYEYQPYHKNLKAVEFINEVMVVYITGDEVVGESTEPLKKELDQQIRNKEMRKGHYPATLFGRRKFEEDYMSAWLKK